MQDDSFPGLLSLVYAFLDTLEIGNDERKHIERYLDLVRRRSNGEVHVGYFPGFELNVTYRPPSDTGGMDSPICAITSCVQT